MPSDRKVSPKGVARGKRKAAPEPKPKVKAAPKVKRKAKVKAAPKAKRKPTSKRRSQVRPEPFSDADAKSIVVLGSTSAMARATAGEFAARGYNILLAARDQEENRTIAADIQVRFGVETAALPFEAEDFGSHEAFFTECRRILGDSIEGVILCFGYMADQTDAQADFAKVHRMVDVCYTGAVSILEIVARHFEERKRGFIAVLSSVAGDRGKQGNYLYGSAKGGLTVYLEGLRNRLFHAGVHVTTIKPGFVDTKMTFGLPGLFLVASPDKAGKAICKAILKRKNTAYVPFFWQYIMLLIRHIPEWQFKKMRM